MGADGQATTGSLVGLDDVRGYSLESDGDVIDVQPEAALVMMLELRTSPDAPWVAFDDPEIDAYVRSQSDAEPASLPWRVGGTPFRAPLGRVRHVP
jgi:hypothetical protein